MSETLESSRRWSGFVCPDCRFVFRVPRDHDGRGIVCPSCRRLLRIPAAGEQTPVLVATLRSVTNESVPEQAVDRRVRRRKRKHVAESQDWEKTGSLARESHHERSTAKWWLLGGSVGLAAVIALVATLMWGNPADPEPPVAGGGETPVSAAPGVSSVDGAAAALRSDVEFIKEAEPLAKRFMEAGSIGDLLPLLRNPEVAEARLRTFYPTGTFKPYGFHKFNTNDFVATEGSIRTVAVANSDFEEKQLSFVESAAGIKIDWESWAGWSEMSWKDFMSAKPVSGKLFRVVLSAVDYYNFAFTDDRKWSSYRLTSPDGEFSLYAYVERDSVLDSKLRLPSDAKDSSLMLKLKYPEDPVSPNQVLIESLTAEGWVLPNESSP